MVTQVANTFKGSSASWCHFQKYKTMVTQVANTFKGAMCCYEATQYFVLHEIKSA